MGVEEHTIELAGSPVFYRSASALSAAQAPAVYLHGVPTCSADWVPALTRTGGIAPDLIGFGRSGKGGHLDYTVEGLADAVEPLLAERIRLTGHDWGALVALELAARAPGRVERLLLINPPPLVAGFSWPAPARIWRRPGLGELAMGATTKWLLGRTLRRGSVRPDAWTPERLAEVWERFDQGTQRAVLRLHRLTDPRRLEAEAERLAGLAVPALVIWGQEDPWYPGALADRVAGLLAQAALERVPGAGHWPWLDRPEVLDRVVEFLA